MRRRLLKDGFTVKVLALVSFLIFVVFALVYFLVFDEFNEARDAEVDRYIRLIEQSIDEAYAFTDSYEHVIDDKLYHVSKNLQFELKDMKAEDISLEELESLKSTYELEGIAIFIQSDDDIVVLNSTMEEEVGSSTKDWGYWFTAFSELMSGDQVSVKKGFSKDGFWVGPRTLSYHAEGYHKYAYIKHSTESYLINPYILDNKLYTLEAAGNLDTTLEDIKNNIEHVDAIGVVDASAWKTYKSEDYSGGGDPIVIYGAVNKATFLNSIYDVDTILQSKEKLVEKLPSGNQKNIYVPIRGNRIVILRVNYNIFDHLVKKIIWVFIGLGLISSCGVLIIAYVLVSNYTALLDLEKQRLKLANTFRKTVKKLPDLIYHCRINDKGDIVLTYNEGKFFNKQQIILTSDNEVLMEKIYSKEFMSESKDFLMNAFNKDRVRFESSLKGRVFDHIVSPVFEEGLDEKTGYVKEIIGFATDITERIKKEQKAEYLAYHDSLTGLPNRLFIKETIQKYIQDPDIGKFSVLYFDLDSFKKINDEAGHQVGDTVLKEIGGRVQTLLSEEAFVGRISGDEFVIIDRAESMESIENLAKRILAMIQMPMHYQEYQFEVNASLGISMYPDDGDDYDTLMLVADRAMYDSKDFDGNHYQFSEEIRIQ